MENKFNIQIDMRYRSIDEMITFGDFTVNSQRYPLSISL